MTQKKLKQGHWNWLKAQLRGIQNLLQEEICSAISFFPQLRMKREGLSQTSQPRENLEIICHLFFFFLINLFIYLFIYFWLRWVFVAVHGLSLIAATKGYSSLWCAGFSLRWLFLLWSMGSRCMGFSSCGTRAQQLWLMGSEVQAQQLWLMGLVAPWHVGSSRTRARTHVSCIGRQILNHCTTREFPTF